MQIVHRGRSSPRPQCRRRGKSLVEFYGRFSGGKGWKGTDQPCCEVLFSARRSPVGLILRPVSSSHRNPQAEPLFEVLANGFQSIWPTLLLGALLYQIDCDSSLLLFQIEIATLPLPFTAFRRYLYEHLDP